jgi:hypothetical protein
VVLLLLLPLGAGEMVPLLVVQLQRLLWCGRRLPPSLLPLVLCTHISKLLLSSSLCLLLLPLSYYDLVHLVLIF